MSSIFLHGGGDNAEWRTDTFKRFADAAQAIGSGPLALVVAEAREEDREPTFAAYRDIFAAVGVDAAAPLFVTPESPLSQSLLAEMQPSGLFVCGGMTPFYHKATCEDRAWLDYLQATGIPFGGTSAGAAIAPQKAILGGWQAERGGTSRAMLFQGASEGLDQVTVAEGLGLVPFAIDVHASQWGTLLRLIHAVDLGLVERGYAIDEDTMLEINGGTMVVHGRGHVYDVRSARNGGASVAVYTAGATIQ